MNSLAYLNDWWVDAQRMSVVSLLAASGLRTEHSTGLTMPLSLEDSPKGSRAYPLTQSDLSFGDFPVVAGVPSPQGFLLHRTLSQHKCTDDELQKSTNNCDNLSPSYCGPQTKRTTCAPSVDMATSAEPWHWSESQVKRREAWPTALWWNLEGEGGGGVRDGKKENNKSREVRWTGNTGKSNKVRESCRIK